jgi:hypothetical protein
MRDVAPNRRRCGRIFPILALCRSGLASGRLAVCSQTRAGAECQYVASAANPMPARAYWSEKRPPLPTAPLAPNGKGAVRVRLGSRKTAAPRLRVGPTKEKRRFQSAAPREYCLQTYTLGETLTSALPRAGAYCCLNCPRVFEPRHARAAM